jgi:hypothetical protein
MIMTPEQAEDMLALQEVLNELKAEKKALELLLKEVEHKLSTQYQPLAEQQFLAGGYVDTLFRVEQKINQKREWIDNPVRVAEILNLDSLIKKSVNLGDVDNLPSGDKAYFDDIIVTKKSFSYKIVKL